MPRRLSSGTREILKFFLLPLSQAHSGASTVLVDELDACGFQRSPDREIVGRRSDVSVSFSSARPAVATLSRRPPQGQNQRASQDAIGLSHRSP